MNALRLGRSAAWLAPMLAAGACAVSFADFTGTGVGGSSTSGPTSASSTASSSGTSSTSSTGSSSSGAPDTCDAGACTDPSMCASSPCVMGTCTSGCCGTVLLEAGTPCHDDAGDLVCSEKGACVASHCLDGIVDGDETDIDCGGMTCPRCADSKACKQDADCLAAACNGASYDAASTCLNHLCKAGPSMMCSGATPICDLAKAACVGCLASSDCPSPSCSGGQVTTGATCDPTNICVGGTTVPCTGGFACASPTACKTTCVVDTDCAGMNHYCSAGACVPKIIAGASCAANDQCISNICGTTGSGNCCAPTPACTIGGVCGATGCATGTGACVYPSKSTTCGAASCNVTMLTPAPLCDGNGTCSMATPAACAGHLRCANATACNTGCGPANGAGDANCAPGYWCDGVGGGKCQALLGTAAVCNRGTQCISGSCVLLVCG